MDSPGLDPEFARRGLGRRKRLRLAAIVLWSGFVGGALTLVAAVALLPDPSSPQPGWAELSIGFLCAWALALVPAAMALLLAHADDGR